MSYVRRFAMSSSASTSGADPENLMPSSTRVPKKKQQTLNRDYWSKNHVAGACQLGIARPSCPPPRGPGRPKRPRTETAATPERATTASATEIEAIEVLEDSTPVSVTIDRATEVVLSGSAPTRPTSAATFATKQKKYKTFKYKWVSKVSSCG